MKNIAYFLMPKSNVAFVYDDYTVRQCIEKMTFHGYSAIPVISREGNYVCTISDGDLLNFITSGGYQKEKEYSSIYDVINKEKNPPVKITSEIDELFELACRQNFVPVIDDSGIFVGIVTRKDIIRYLYEHQKSEN